MKKLILFIFVTVFMLQSSLPLAARAAGVPAQPQLNAEAAVLIDGDSGRILYEKNSHQKIYPASTTKVLTAILALQYLKLDDMITVGREIDSVALDASKAGLVKGEQISVRDLLWGLLLPSGCDAAQTLAVNIAKKAAKDSSLSIDNELKKYEELMNKKLQELGAKDSHFTNPDGTHDDNHYSSAYDLALIAREAMKNDLFREIVKTSEYKYNSQANKNNVGLIGKHDLTWVNINELIKKQSKYYYEYATGIKTGHTTPAGYCLVSSAEKDGFKLFAVAAKCTEEAARWTDSKTLLEYGYSNFSKRIVLDKGQAVGNIPALKKFTNSEVVLNPTMGQAVSAVLSESNLKELQKKYVWNGKLMTSDSESGSTPRIINSIKKGDVIGKVLYILNGETVGQADLLADKDVNDSRILGITVLVGKTIYRFKYIALPVVLIAAAVFLVLNRKKRKV